jgi:general L-amino acid transport system permease protein
MAARPAHVSALRRAVSSPLDMLLSLIALLLGAAIVVPVARWAIFDATWTGTSTTCRSVGGGACWAFIGHKLPFILFGLFPAELRWRPAVVTVLLLALIIMSAMPRFWRRSLLLTWAVGLGVSFWLMHGGAGLESVPTRAWGGLPITLMLTAMGLGAGFPLAVVLALGRRSNHAVPRVVATTFVEVIRGIPLIAVLYVAALVVPLALPRGIELEKLVLATGAVTVFAAAYLAEAVRAGLQVVPRGQYEAAFGLGLTWWQVMRSVVLPQALRVVSPSCVSIAVGFFQDTSLVVIIGLFDLLNTARLSAQDPDWLGFHAEALVFVAVLYFVGSAALSRYGLWLEKRFSYLGASTARMRMDGVTP